MDVAAVYAYMINLTKSNSAGLCQTEDLAADSPSLCHYSGKPYQRTFSDADATGLQELRWDDAELFQASVEPVMAYDDAFTLMEVWLMYIRVCVLSCMRSWSTM